MALTETGRLYFSQGVFNKGAMEEDFWDFVWDCVFRFTKEQDWGSIDDVDKALSDAAFLNNGRICAMYDLPAAMSAVDEEHLLFIRENGETSIFFAKEY
ncbi:hypothetical protein AGMMS49992_27120 [Clostridia bacterium]|nr:hypothetical protein AGMMS49992_27120 [Clostridia bacterium]